MLHCCSNYSTIANLPLRCHYLGHPMGPILVNTVLCVQCTSQTATCRLQWLTDCTAECLFVIVDVTIVYSFEISFCVHITRDIACFIVNSQLRRCLTSSLGYSRLYNYYHYILLLPLLFILYTPVINIVWLLCSRVLIRLIILLFTLHHSAAPCWHCCKADERNQWEVFSLFCYHVYWWNKIQIHFSRSSSSGTLGPIFK